MSCSSRSSQCALALAIGAVFLCSTPPVFAAPNGRAPGPRRVAMASQVPLPEHEMPPPQPAGAFADDGGYAAEYGGQGGYYGSNCGPGGCCASDGYYAGGSCGSGGGACCDGCYSDGYGGGCYGEGCGDGCYGEGCGDGCYGGCYDGCYGDCGTGYGCHPAMCSQGAVTPRCAVWAEYLYLQVTDADVAHAQQQDGLDPPGSGLFGTSPFGDIGTVDMEYDHGARIGAAIGCGCNSSVLASWTYFESESTDRLAPPTAVGGGLGAVGSFLHHPGVAPLASLGPVDALYEVEFHLGDVLYNRVLITGNRYCIGLLAGAQYGHLEQRFAQLGDFAGGAGGVIGTATSIEFDGGGLKAGIDGEGQLSRYVSVYGRMTGAAMSGRFRSRYTMLNTTGDVLLAQVNWSDDRIVPHLEYELGIACTMCHDCVRISSGYMFSHWFNTVTTSELVNAVRADNYVDVGDTLSFEGFVSRIEVRW